jgi:hypothetical protein
MAITIFIRLASVGSRRAPALELSAAGAIVGGAEGANSRRVPNGLATQVNDRLLCYRRKQCSFRRSMSFWRLPRIWANA